MDKIEYEVLRKLQLTQLEILIEFDRICKANNIPYQLFSGTLLGAVRHNGFIPWDDDIDVCMLRKDYNKFLKICSDQLNEKYFLQNYNTEKEFMHVFTRIRKNNTLQFQKVWSELNIHHGIFIDIFPMDNILPDKLIGKVQYTLLYSLKKLRRFRSKEYCLMEKRILKKFMKLCAHNFMKVLKMHNYNKLQTMIICMFQNKKTTFSSLLVEGKEDVYHKYMIKNSDFYKIITIRFEGYLLPGPKNYHEILTNIFGDYMTPPSYDQQKPHHGVIKISFDTTKDNKIHIQNKG